jgi:hypothetical protein
MFRQTVPLSETKTWDEISLEVRKTYKNACIVYIDKCVFPPLKTRYEKNKKEGMKEILVWHGTSEEVTDKICKEGFDPKYNKRSRYGKGVYFSSDLKISLDEEYASKDTGELNNVFFCKICLTKEEEQDSKIFVVPSIEQSLPLFVVGFYKTSN